MSGERVLVVDDEPIVTEVVQRYLIREGYQVQVAADGRAALKEARDSAPDLVVLDLMLPEIDGLEVCRQLRAESSVPIIMLTAKGEDSDKILGLGLGADDYLTKPFSPGELIARVKAVLRRTQAAAPTLPGDVVRIGGLRINPGGRAVERDGEADPPDRQGVRPALLPGKESRPGLHPRAAAGQRLGLRVVRRPEHGHRPHPPPAREDRAEPGPAPLRQDGLGRRLQAGAVRRGAAARSRRTPARSSRCWRRSSARRSSAGPSSGCPARTCAI